MKISLEVPRYAAWSTTEQAAFNEHLRMIYDTIAEDCEDDYHLRIRILTDAERRSHQIDHEYRFQPFAYCDDLDTSSAYSEHWFVIPAYRGRDLVTSESDWNLVHGKAS